ncbi:Wzz/FepE/Etk N-terminal domain-containing protein [Paenibacillus koleovorans]|uniref:Wzz/FepE/Etk N-terminal domain-containing protein n=1 Tax=Paenibacillus koleovorans TaxID=121608 RepID=UPI0013E38FC6|nr:Wzz/FepE/Etk N-terminal domain-containing protein [Paenibacillus koleovorans]
MQDELSIRDIVQRLWLKKILIIAVSLSVAVCALFINLFYLKSVYEASATVGIGKEKPELIKSYIASINNDTFTSKLVQRNKLDSLGYTTASLKGAVKFEQLEGTGYVRIKLRGNEPEKITNIVNLFSNALASRIEIIERSQSIVESKKQLVEVSESYLLIQSEIATAEEELKQTPELIVTKKALADDPYLYGVVSQGAVEKGKAGAIQLISEHENENYYKLKEIISEKKIELSKADREKKMLENKISTNEKRIETLEQNPSNPGEDQQGYQRQVTEFTAVSIAPALEPETAIGPNRLLNVISVFMLSLILMIIAVTLKKIVENNNGGRKND